MKDLDITQQLVTKISSLTNTYAASSKRKNDL